MKQIIIIAIMILMLLAISIEAFIIIKQSQSIEVLNKKLIEMNEDTDKLLAEKVIIQAYKEFHKAGNLSSVDNIDNVLALDTLKSNFEIVKNSYNGSDQDITNMLNIVYDYLDSKRNAEFNSNILLETRINVLEKYSAAKNALGYCISKYALFDKVGLE